MTRILPLSETTDPTAVPDQAILYSKDTGGVTRGFIRNSDGSIVPLSGSGTYALPEVWAYPNVAASLTAAVMSAQVSGVTNTVRMVRDGSIVGLVAQLSEAITAGQLTINITKNGTPIAFNMVLTSGTGSQVAQAYGIDTYVAGDLIGVTITTDAGFLPITTDLETWVQVSDGGAPGGGGGSAVAISKSALSGTFNFTTMTGVVDWLGYSGSFYPGHAPPRSLAYGTSGPIVKRQGTKEILNGLDWFLTGTNVTFNATSIGGGLGVTVQANIGDVSYPYAAYSSSAAWGVNAGDAVNFGFCVSIPSASFERKLRVYLGIGEATIGITARLADGSVVTDSITVPAETNQAHFVEITWTAGHRMTVYFNVNSQSSASGGGVYLYGLALL